MRARPFRCWIIALGGCFLLTLEKRSLLFESSSSSEKLIKFRVSENASKYPDSRRDIFIANLLRQTELVPKYAPWYVAPPNKQGQIDNLAKRIRKELKTPARAKAGIGSLLLYVIQNGTLLAIEDQHKTFAKYHSGFYWDRWRPYQEMLQFSVDIAHQISWRNDKDTPELNTRINQMLDHPIPLIFDGFDWRHCARFDGKKLLEKFSFPYFTFAMSSESSTTCTPFAIPCYEMWQRFKRTQKLVPKNWAIESPYHEWDIHMQQNFTAYPWEHKIPKVVWRGTSTGRESSRWQELPRFQLVMKGVEHQDTMDFAFSKLNQGWEKPPYAEAIQEALGDKVGNSIAFSDFMKYKGILDLEGNSWSSRLGHLFCLNSVVLRVDRKLVNYFESELQPWVHYIPIKEDFSDLEQQAKFIADSRNDEILKTMVQVSNEWCRSKMTLSQFAVDMLHVLLSYVEFIREEDEGWFDQWHDIIKRRKWATVTNDLLFQDGKV